MGNRSGFKFGLVFLVLGVLLILWAWGSWSFRVAPEAPTSNTVDTALSADMTPDYSDSPNAPSSSSSRGSSSSLRDVDIAAWRLILFVLLVLFLSVLFGTYFIIRFARRYRARAEHNRAPATTADDVWASHKLPD